MWPWKYCGRPIIASGRRFWRPHGHRGKCDLGLTRALNVILMIAFLSLNVAVKKGNLLFPMDSDQWAFPMLYPLNADYQARKQHIQSFKVCGMNQFESLSPRLGEDALTMMQQPSWANWPSRMPDLFCNAYDSLWLNNDDTFPCSSFMLVVNPIRKSSVILITDNCSKVITTLMHKLFKTSSVFMRN